MFGSRKFSEPFMLDERLLSDILHACSDEAALQKRLMDKYKLKCKTEKTYGEIPIKTRAYFISHICHLKWGRHIERCEKVIRRITPVLGKLKKKINIRERELAAEHARNTSIEDVVSSFLHISRDELKKRVICPFHEGKSKNMAVYPKTDSYHCFSCGASGDTIKFVMDLERCSFPEAVEKLSYYH